MSLGGQRPKREYLQVDIAPTLALLTGVPIPRYSDAHRYPLIRYVSVIFLVKDARR
jgi:hypothetical protein